MDTDLFELQSSMDPQSRGAYSSFVDKQSNSFISDSNSAVYTNNSQSLVQFDLSQIYNSSKWTSTNDLFLTLPIVTVAAFSAGATLVAPGTSSAYGLVSHKSG